MKKRLVLFFLLVSPSLMAQLKVRETGQILAGNPMTVSDNPNYPPLDSDTTANIIVYGPNGDNRARGRIAFGDQIAAECLNVMIGEYGLLDSDQLWLHGKNGSVFTHGGEANNIWGEYKVPWRGNCFQFNCDVLSTGVFVASDVMFKENIEPITNSLENIKKINSVSYKLKYDKILGGRPEKKHTSSTRSQKEINDEKLMDEFYNSLDNKLNRFGFLAQEVEKVFPELIQKDTVTGSLYVDYLGMIPIAINAIKELEQKVEIQASYIEDLESRLSTIEAILNPKKGNTQRNTTNIEENYENGVARIHQNIPNPFREETKIPFDLPESVKNASIYIHNLQGKEMKKIIIEERGSNYVVVKNDELEAGLYTYILIVDNKEAGSRKMILIK